MALTKISTGGVKDDAVGQNQLADNSVVLANLTNDCVDGSKIADEAISEGRLEISNAGTNGQFLSKQSGNTGGLTWADAITAIADDSITQAKIADDAIGQDQLAQNAVVADNLTADCVTSVKIADGAVTEYRIADNEVTEPKLKISNAGTNCQYLQKQSGNTGGLTWAEVQSAPTITATASGAISDQAAVAINSSGQAIAITETINENNPPTGHQFLYQASGPAHHSSNSGGKWPLVKWDDSVKVAVAINQMAGGNEMRLTTGRITGNSIDWDLPTGYQVTTNGTQTQLLETNGSGLFLVGMRSNSNGYTYLWPIQVASDGTITKSSAQQPSSDYIDVDGLNNTSCDIVWTGSQFVIAWQQSGELKFRGVTVSGSAGSHTLSFGSVVYVGASGTINPRLTWDPDTSRVICTYRDGGASKYVMLSASGNTVTKYTEATISSTTRYDEYGDVVYDEHQNRVIHMWMKDGSGDQDRRIYVNAGTVTGGSTNTISWSSDSDAGYRGQEGYVVYDSTIKKVVMFFNVWSTTSSSPDDQVFSRIIGGSGTTISYGTGGSIFTDNDCRVEHPRGCYCPAENKHITIARRPIGNATGLSILSTAGTASSNMSSTSDFVGFASQAYTNGQTATINVVGNTATKSGLTAGTKYYVQNDGSLGTTAGSHSAIGGIALSATKLLIK